MNARASRAVVAVLLFTAATKTVLAEDEVEVESRKMAFSESAGSLNVSLTISDLFDERAYEALGSGVAAVIVVRFYVHKKGEVEPAAFALAKVRVVWDHWDEHYLVQVEGPLGVNRSTHKRRSAALQAVTVFEKFSIARLDRIAVGPHYLLSMVVELNPVSAELRAEVRRWLTKPAGRARLDSGSSFFGSFVSVFVNPKLAEADRVVKYRSQPFYRVHR